MAGLDFRGHYINLERSAARRAAMESALERFGLNDRISRFAAMEGDGRAAAISKSQLGCFLSHHAIVAAADLVRYTLVLEDDIAFPDQFGRYWALVAPAIERQDCDIVFLNQTADFANLKVVSDLLRAKRSAGDIYARDFARFSLQDCKPYYAAGAVAYLIRPGAAPKLLAILDRAAAVGYQAPLDLVYRAAIRSGELSARFVFPYILGTGIDPLSTVVPDKGRQSGPLFNDVQNLFVAGGDIAGLERGADAVAGAEDRDVDAFVAAQILYRLLRW
jgi:GR25 family glycosyltransferase involved in LPS biosynthesis